MCIKCERWQASQRLPDSNILSMSSIRPMVPSLIKFMSILDHPSVDEGYTWRATSLKEHGTQAKLEMVRKKNSLWYHNGTAKKWDKCFLWYYCDILTLFAINVSLSIVFHLINQGKQDTACARANSECPTLRVPAFLLREATRTMDNALDGR